MAKEHPVVIVDNGSYECKVGLAGKYDHPQYCCRTVLGRPKHLQMVPWKLNQKYLIGGEALRDRFFLNLSYPIDNCIIKNLDDMEIIWHHAFFEELRVTPEDHPTLLTETPMNPKCYREKMTQILFETFNVPSFYVAIQAVLSLYTSGRTTGIVLDSGYGVSHAVPIYEGYALPHAVLRIDLAGRECTQYLVHILQEQIDYFKMQAKMELAEDIIQNFCYVALDYEEELKKYEQSYKNIREYRLPDNSSVAIRNERFRCPEILFKPNFFDLEKSGIHELTFKSIMGCDIDLRRDLYSNIVLSGGNTLFPGFPDRFNKEVSQLAPPNMKIQVVAQPNRKFGTWIGGQILSQLPTFQDNWITRSEYDEYGPNIVHRKCF